MQLKLNLKNSEQLKKEEKRKYREILKRLKWYYVDNGGEKGTWREYANERGIYYSLSRYISEIENEEDLMKIYNGIYVSKGEK